MQNGVLSIDGYKINYHYQAPLRNFQNAVCPAASISNQVILQLNPYGYSPRGDSSWLLQDEQISAEKAPLLPACLEESCSS